MKYKTITGRCDIEENCRVNFYVLQLTVLNVTHVFFNIQNIADTFSNLVLSLVTVNHN